MANEKISAMPSADPLIHSDLLTVVQGGVNKKATKEQVLTAGNFEAITLKGFNGNTITIASNGDITITCEGGFQFRVIGSNFTVWQIDGGGNSFFNGQGDVTLTRVGSGQTILIHAGGIDITFTDTSGNWTGGVTDMAAAIQRLAAAVAGLLAGPIP